MRHTAGHCVATRHLMRLCDRVAGKRPTAASRCERERKRAWARRALASARTLPAMTRAGAGSATAFVPQFLAAQATFIGQRLEPMHAAYSGPESLPTAGERDDTRAYGLSLGVPLVKHVALYFGAGWFTGAGINKGAGLAGYVNEDAVRAGPGSGTQHPYVARVYLQWTLPLSSSRTPVSTARDQLPGWQPDPRLRVKVGRLAVTDEFDQNRYAHSPRTQFLNWDVIHAAAYDYAADTHGYSNRTVIALVRPRWTLRYGFFQMPQRANVQALASIGQANGQQLQRSVRPFAHRGAVWRVLLYRNTAAMGLYEQAVALANQTGATPDILADDHPGRQKCGHVINTEWPWADGGATRLFARRAWDDGRTESFAYTEADRAASIGGQICGVHWKRPDDRLGRALGIDGFSGPHRVYLARGRCGFMLCDGALNYGHERVIEAYYRAQLGRYLQISPDSQWIAHPGYNRARGPALVIGMRSHVALRCRPQRSTLGRHLM